MLDEEMDCQIPLVELYGTSILDGSIHSDRKKARSFLRDYCFNHNKALKNKRTSKEVIICSDLDCEWRVAIRLRAGSKNKTGEEVVLRQLADHSPRCSSRRSIRPGQLVHIPAFRQAVKRRRSVSAAVLKNILIKGAGI